MPTTDRKLVDPKYDFRCYCGSNNIEYEVWESSDGGHEDYHYYCMGCGRNWWIDGIDS